MGSNFGLVVVGVLVAITNLTLTAFASSAPGPGTRGPAVASVVSESGPQRGGVDADTRAQARVAETWN